MPLTDDARARLTHRASVARLRDRFRGHLGFGGGDRLEHLSPESVATMHALLDEVALPIGD
mgnify:CR=1 FL=1